MSRLKEGINPLSIKKYWKDLTPPDIRKLQKEKKKFIDPTFPPNKNTLLSKNQNGEYIDKVRGPKQYQEFLEDNPEGPDKFEWKSVTDISEKWEVFADKIEFNDVNQGSLGDCYFLSSITSLTEFPYLLKEKFRTQKFNEEGYYEVIFFIDGEWQIIFLDDYFPYDPAKKTFAFCKPQGNELWAILLEKAWAKLNGGYTNIIGGIVSEPICALTGFPTEFLPHKNFEEEDIFIKIEEGDKEGTIMSSASKGKDEVEQRGLVRSHAYTLITAKKWEQRNIYLIKLRNPWGEGEWKGNWSDESSSWTDEYKKYFNYEKKDDGIFWIDISDYMNNFESTYICYILYGAIVKSFYFEYQSYFKRPVIFNMRVKQKSKMSVGVLFKGWRFNRQVKDLTHPFSLIVCKYDNNRKIEQLWGNWGCKEDLNIIEFFEPGFYVIWLYLATQGDNDPNFKYTVQVSSLEDFDIEFLGLDQNFQLIQYLLLENYKKTGENNLLSSKDYFVGTDKNVSKFGLSNLLLYNKTGKEMEVKASAKSITNVHVLPPYEGLSNLQINIPPYESVAIVAIRLTNDSASFSYGFKILMKGNSNDNNPNKWRENNGDKYSNFLKFNIINNNPETSGLRTGEYKYVGRNLAQQMPKFNAAQFVGKSILEKAMSRKEEVNLDTLQKDYPKEMNLLLEKFPENKEKEDENKNKKWDCVKSDDGKYVGQIDTETGNLEGKGAFIWNNGVKYIGNWKEGNMAGQGQLYDKDNKLIFDGNYYKNKKFGLGKFIVKDKEYYEGEFYDDKMEGKGSYHYENGDVWEGNFKNNKKNGVGVMKLNNSNDVFLYEFENDNYMGATLLNPEEKDKVLNLQKEEKNSLIDSMKLILQKKESEYIEEHMKKQEKEKEKESGLNKYTSNLFLQKSMIGFGIKVTQMSQQIEETPEEKYHKTYLDNVELNKKKEPFMTEKFLDVNPLDYEEDIELIEKKKTKYFGGVAKKKDSPNSFVMQGRGVLFDGKNYYSGYWDNNKPNGFFFVYNADKEINFRGFFNKDFSIDPNKKGRVFFKNGDRYEGFFNNNNKMHGIGTYYFPSGSSLTGTFNNGKFDGVGKYFYDNGFISEIITYKKNKIVERSKKIREDYRDPNSESFFKQINGAYPGVIDHILQVPPIRDCLGDLIWVVNTFKNGDIYIGQVDSEKQFHGRCCLIYQNKPSKYFVGYIKENEFFGEGTLYDKNWKIIYEGNFEHNQKNGFGILKNNDGSTYAGEFLNDKPHGRGVLHYQNDARFEGNFNNGYQNDKGVLISGDFMKKQEIEYDNGNIIDQGEIIDFKKGKNKKKFQNELSEFEKTCKKYGYEKFMNLMMNLKPTEDNYMLKKGIKEEVSGLYIGEMNYVGFKYGRGVLIDTYTKTYYVGYFKDNEKSGNGVNYNANGKQQYIGEFKRNKPIGKGEYKYETGETLQGIFNSAGEGKGEFISKRGNFWKGDFYAWTLNGNGTLYTKDGNLCGEKSFELNEPINK